MGAVLGSQMRETMEENFKKNQEFMLATQKMQVYICNVYIKYIFISISM